MKTNITLLIILLFSFYSCSEKEKVNKHNDLIKEKIKGKVSTIIGGSYAGVEKNGEIEKGELLSKYDLKYDEYGNKIEVNSYKSDGSLEFKTIYKYDDNGNKTEEKSYRSNRSLLVKSVSKYDEKGDKIEEYFYRSDSSLIVKLISKYDENGNKIEENSYNSDGSLKSEDTYKYEYDKAGNWITQIGFNNGNPIFITERVIEYYL